MQDINERINAALWDYIAHYRAGQALESTHEPFDHYLTKIVNAMQTLKGVGPTDFWHASFELDLRAQVWETIQAYSKASVAEWARITPDWLARAKQMLADVASRRIDETLEDGPML